VGGADILFGKLKAYMQDRLFDVPVDLDDLNVLRNLSEPQVTRGVLDLFKKAVNDLTVHDKGSTEVRDYVRLTKARPFVTSDQAHLVPKKSVFNKIVCANPFELDVASFLEGSEVVSFAKNNQKIDFKIEYRTADGGIANYYPDFIVKETDAKVWIIETKGRTDTKDPLKWERLCQWCADASAKDGGRTYQALFVPEEKWHAFKPRTFRQMTEVFAGEKPI
jgi:type III restriction enzyme